MVVEVKVNFSAKWYKVLNYFNAYYTVFPNIFFTYSVQEDHETSIQDFINIVKKKDQTTKVKKCFGNMTNMTEEVKDKINEILSLLTERSTIKDFRDKLLTQLIEDLVLLILMIEQWPAFMARQVFYALDDRTLEPERDARRTFKDHSLYKHAEKRYVILSNDLLTFAKLEIIQLRYL